MRKRAHNFIDLTGQKFGRLTVVTLVEVDYGIKWFCVCDCGNNTTTSAAKLKSGHTKSCGCILSEKTSARNTTHGLYRHPLFNLAAEVVVLFPQSKTQNHFIP
jgi:hypothetical protein